MDFALNLYSFRFLRCSVLSIGFLIFSLMEVTPAVLIQFVRSWHYVPSVHYTFYQMAHLLYWKVLRWAFLGVCLSNTLSSAIIIFLPPFTFVASLAHTVDELSSHRIGDWGRFCSTSSPVSVTLMWRNLEVSLLYSFLCKLSTIFRFLYFSFAVEVWILPAFFPVFFLSAYFCSLFSLSIFSIVLPVLYGRTRTKSRLLSVCDTNISCYWCVWEDKRVTLSLSYSVCCCEWWYTGHFRHTQNFGSWHRHRFLSTPMKALWTWQYHLTKW